MELNVLNNATTLINEANTRGRLNDKVTQQKGIVYFDKRGVRYKDVGAFLNDTVKKVKTQVSIVNEHIKTLIVPIHIINNHFKTKTCGLERTVTPSTIHYFDMINNIHVFIFNDEMCRDKVMYISSEPTYISRPMNYVAFLDYFNSRQ